MFPNRQQLRVHTERVRQAQHQALLARHRWQGSLKAEATTPRGLAIGFALGFGIGCALRASPGEGLRKVITLPTLLGTVRALLLAQ